MSTEFASTHFQRKMTLTPTPESAGGVRWVEVTLSGVHVVNLDVVLVTPNTRMWLDGYLPSDEQYAIARDAARTAVRHYKVKVKDLDQWSARLLTMDRATHAAAREQELADCLRGAAS